MSITNTVSSVTTTIRGLINDQVKSDGQNVFVFNTDNKFRISESFIQSPSIIVYKNGVDITDSNWSYNSDTNEITISFTTSGDVLNKDDIILITYNYYKKYSDAEIEGFLESSFVYFVQYRYKKIFSVNEDKEIIAENNTNPTSDELYFISIISSILIDPQNIEVKTSDFSLSAKRNTSDLKQISDAFAQFKRFVGKI